MQKVKIGTNKALEAKQRANGAQKVKTLNDAIKLVTDAGFDIKSIEAFKRSFTGYVIDTIRSEGKLFKKMPEARLFELFNISYKELFKLEREYLNNPIELDAKNNPIYQDATDYAEGKKQIEVYNTINTLKSNIEQLESLTGRKFNRQDISGAFTGIFDNLNAHTLKPNTGLIKSVK